MYRNTVVGALHPFVWSFGSLDLNKKVQVYWHSLHISCSNSPPSVLGCFSYVFMYNL